jgi:predicted ATP-dependent protease
VVDIDREVELGGPLHSKGVLILSHYLAAHYAQEVPLSLSASLVFEQSYSGVDGDSASCAELCALLSALADAPIRQCLAITGAINQNGLVQAIGGVNDKIEGFFDVCSAAGLTGDQGVVIPRANVRHLMLREDVVEAVAAGRFSVYAVTNVAEAIELLTGTPAGVRSIVDGEFPEGSINYCVENRMREFSYAMRRYSHGEPGDGEIA